MLIALLAVLGVDLIVVIVILAIILARRRWVSRQPGSFKGTAHVTDGDIPPLGKRTRRGYGRWVSDVLVFNPGPLCLRNTLAQIDAVEEHHPATGKVRRLGDHPEVIVLASGGAHLEITVASQDLPLVLTSRADAGQDAPGVAATELETPASTGPAPSGPPISGLSSARGGA